MAPARPGMWTYKQYLVMKFVDKLKEPTTVVDYASSELIKISAKAICGFVEMDNTLRMLVMARVLAAAAAAFQQYPVLVPYCAARLRFSLTRQRSLPLLFPVYQPMVCCGPATGGAH